MKNVDQSNLRLEVEADHNSGLVNGVKNPNGDLGAWGWVTPVDHSYLKGGAGQVDPKLTFISQATGAAMWMASEPMPVTPGQYAAGYFVDQGGTVPRYRASIEWLDGTLAVLSTAGPWPAAVGGAAWTPSAGTARTLGAVVVPAGAVFARLRIDFYSATDATPSAFQWSFNKVTFVTAATTAELGPTRTNFISNHDFTGTSISGWAPWQVSAAIARATVPTTSTSALRMRPPAVAGTQTFGAYHQNIPVLPGRDYVFSITPRSAVASGRVRPSSGYIGIIWFTSAGQLVGISGDNLSFLTAETTHYATGSAPSTAAYARPYVSLTGATNAEYYITGAQFELGTYPTAMFEGNATESIGYVAPDAFINILGDTHAIRIDPRGELQVGTLSATIVNSALDPAVASFIKPDQRMRLLVKTGTTGSPSDWEPIYTGTLLQAQVDYDASNPNASKRATISLTAVDNVSALAKAPSPFGVGTIAETPYVLEGAGVPWSVNGSGDEVPTATVVAYNDGYSAADELALTRDSTLGYVWVDRFNVVQVWDRTRMPATPKATLDESVYNKNVSIDYDTDRVIDSVLVNLLTFDVGHGVAGQITYGPYVLPGSEGSHQTTFTVAGMSEAQIKAFAENVLELNGTATRRVNSVTVPIRADEAGLVDPLALLDLYDLVHVSNTAAGLSENHRITSITHEITAQVGGSGGSGGKWLMTLGFAADGSVASPQLLPSSQIGAIVSSVDEWEKNVSYGVHDPLADLITPNSATTVGGMPDAADVGDIMIVGSEAYVCTTAYTGGGVLETNWSPVTNLRTLQMVLLTATAVLAADNANQAAIAAQASADGKNRIVYAASAPGLATPGTVGDTWWVVSGGLATAQYKLTAISGATYTWSMVQLDSAVIAYLDVYKLTGALADFVKARIAELDVLTINASTTTWTTDLTSTTKVNTTITGNGIATAVVNGGPVHVKIKSGLSVSGGSVSVESGSGVNLGNSRIYDAGDALHLAPWNTATGTGYVGSGVVLDGLSTGGSIVALQVSGSGHMVIPASTRRFKTQIQPILQRYPLATLRAVAGVLFRWIDHPDIPDATKDGGFIAEQIASLGIEELVVRHGNGDILGVHYDRAVAFCWVMTAAAWDEIDSLKAEQATTNARLSALEAS